MYKSWKCILSEFRNSNKMTKVVLRKIQNYSSILRHEYVLNTVDQPTKCNKCMYTKVNDRSVTHISCWHCKPQDKPHVKPNENSNLLLGFGYIRYQKKGRWIYCMWFVLGCLIRIRRPSTIHTFPSHSPLLPHLLFALRLNSLVDSRSRPGVDTIVIYEKTCLDTICAAVLLFPQNILRSWPSFLFLTPLSRNLDSPELPRYVHASKSCVDY